MTEYKREIVMSHYDEAIVKVFEDGTACRLVIRLLRSEDGSVNVFVWDHGWQAVTDIYSDDSNSVDSFIDAAIQIVRGVMR